MAAGFFFLLHFIHHVFVVLLAAMRVLSCITCLSRYSSIPCAHQSLILYPLYARVFFCHAICRVTVELCQ